MALACHLARWSAAACACTAATVALDLAGAAAQPMVRVRAGSQIELRGTLTPRGVEVQGALLDDLGHPLSQQRVQLLVAPEVSLATPLERSLRSGDDGSFRARFALPPGDYAARARFEGNAHLAPSEQARKLDFGRADVSLRFVAPREPLLDLELPAHEVCVIASSPRGAGRLELTLSDELDRELGRGLTQPDGTFRALVPSNNLGTAGLGRLRAYFVGDASHAPANTEIEVVRRARTSLDLQARIDRASGRILITGSLGARGSGLATKAIGLFDGPEHLDTVLTDAQGAFRYTKLPLPQAGQPKRMLNLQARFESDAFWLEGSRSRVWALELAPEVAPSSLWLLGALALSALALFALGGRAPRTTRVTAAVASERAAGIHLDGGRTRVRSEQRQIAGVVLDAGDARPLAGATITLVAGATPIELTTDARGCFASAELPAGMYRLTVCAPAHREAQGMLSNPHRGQWSAVEIRLESLRDAAVRAYRPVALRALPSPALWPVWTARETMAHAQRAGRATESFVQLSERVERAAYAEHPPTQDEVASIERTARDEDIAKTHERA